MSLDLSTIDHDLNGAPIGLYRFEMEGTEDFHPEGFPTRVLGGKSDAPITGLQMRMLACCFPGVARCWRVDNEEVVTPPVVDAPSISIDVSGLDLSDSSTAETPAEPSEAPEAARYLKPEDVLKKGRKKS